MCSLEPFKGVIVQFSAIQLSYFAVECHSMEIFCSRVPFKGGYFAIKCHSKELLCSLIHSEELFRSCVPFKGVILQSDAIFNEVIVQSNIIIFSFHIILIYIYLSSGLLINTFLDVLRLYSSVTILCSLF